MNDNMMEKVKLSDFFVDEKILFEEKWNLKIYKDYDNGAIWASRTGTPEDVALIMHISDDGNYNFVNKEKLSEQCYNHFCDTIREYILIQNIYKSADERNSKYPESEALTEEDLIKSYIVTRHLRPKPKLK